MQAAQAAGDAVKLGGECVALLKTLEMGSDEKTGENLLIGMVSLAVVLLLVAGLGVGAVQFKTAARKLKKETGVLLAKLQAQVDQEMLRRFSEEATNSETRWASLLVGTDAIECMDEIGQGEFGVIYKGTLSRSVGRDEVAVKMLKSSDPEEQQDFLMEARLLAMLDHPGIVRICGVQSEEMPLLIAFELLQGGSLLSYIRDAAQNPSLAISAKDCCTCVLHIAEAVHYLHNIRIVHRDLAARNILVGSNITDIRVSDFGLSRRMQEGKDYYKKLIDDKIPVKWMPLESIQHKKYSTASDTWSFGVVVWELFSGGEVPFSTYSAIETVLAIAQGKRLARPHDCPEHMYGLLLRCWDVQPEERIPFPSLIEHLKRITLSSDVAVAEVSTFGRLSTISSDKQYWYERDSFLRQSSEGSAQKKSSGASSSPDGKFGATFTNMPAGPFTRSTSGYYAAYNLTPLLEGGSDTPSNSYANDDALRQLDSLHLPNHDSVNSMQSDSTPFPALDGEAGLQNAPLAFASNSSGDYVQRAPSTNSVAASQHTALPVSTKPAGHYMDLTSGGVDNVLDQFGQQTLQRRFTATGIDLAYNDGSTTGSAPSNYSTHVQTSDTHIQMHATHAALPLNGGVSTVRIHGDPSYEEDLQVTEATLARTTAKSTVL